MKRLENTLEGVVPVKGHRFGARMNKENLRNLKHELRTPVNHILGYSELLLEAAADIGDGAATVQATHIRASGTALAKLLERNFLVSAEETDQRKLSAVHADLKPLVVQILAASTRCYDLAGSDCYAEDLDRIRQAAGHLMGLIDEAQASAF